MTDLLPSTAARFRKNLLAWGEDNLRSFPWRAPGTSVYEMFVAEFFLTQTPAEHVAEVHSEFVATYPSLAVIEEATIGELTSIIEPLGFQHMQAEALTESAATHDTVPTAREELLALPRVGAYVADATLCFSVGEPRPLLDRNVERVYGRVFGDAWPPSEPAQREFAGEMLPSERTSARRYNLALLDFGALVCTKQNPSCLSCFAREYRTYYAASGTAPPTE